VLHSAQWAKVRRGLLLIAFWCIPPFLVAAQLAADARTMNRPFAYWSAVLWGSPRWLFWAPATPLIAWLSRRYPLIPTFSGRHLLIHVAVLAALTPLATAVWAIQLRAQPGGWPYDLPTLFTILLPICLLWSTVLYFAILAFHQAVDAARREQAAEARLVEAKMDSLRRQLQPHFFFNTLHTISGLIRTQRHSEAISVIARLGDLMREALAESQGQLTTLRHELELIDLYLEIQSIRFQDRLKVEKDLDAAALHCAVPVLLLQPLVENAIEHGVAHTPGGGWVSIAARTIDHSVRIELRNSGGPLQPMRNGGVGLRNARERLRTLYGAAASIEIADDARQSVLVTVQLPFSPGDSDADYNPDHRR
jgi:signal transduction histidine kinase